MLERSDYDLVLMDCQMPEMDGFAATRATATERRTIVALTANAISGDRDLCLAAGIDDYMAKPYTKQQLEQMLRRWLTRRAPQPIAPAGDNPAGGEAGPDEAAPALDMKVFDEYRELDPEGRLGLAKQIARVFLETTNEAVDKVGEAIAVGDADALRRAAHGLRSSAANVGGMTLAGIFKELERLDKEGCVVEAASQIALVRREYERLLAELRALEEEGA